MAIRARLIAPPAEKSAEWPFHRAKWSTLSSQLLLKGDRRMEAATFLSSGYGIRLAIEDRQFGWRRLGSIARVWQPSRLKGILLSPDAGVPFLAATQLFDIRPVPRKWLAIEQTANAEDRYVKQGTILVSCSGAVGRATLAFEPHANKLITHDLLRIEPFDLEQSGWLYAFLRSSQARAMMSGAQYGHIIKHLETSHLNDLPIPIVRDQIADDFLERTQKILALRNRAHNLSLEAEARFEKALGSPRIDDWGERGFEVHASSLFTTRRRLEASIHNPGADAVRRHLAKYGTGFSKLRESGFDVWLPTRFRRIPAEDGVLFIDSADLFGINPDLTKRIAEVDFGDPYKGRVIAGWLLLARSGQVYGINGSLIIATKSMEDKIVSDHVIRIAPRKDALLRVGYVLVALSHPIMGRPLVKSIAYGSSIPEIDPVDFSDTEIVRLTSNEENAIADLSDKASASWQRADEIERDLSTEASMLIDQFIAGQFDNFEIARHRSKETTDKPSQ